MLQIGNYGLDFPASVNNQARIFLYSVLGGMIIAFIYDVFRIKRKTVKTRTIVIYFEDLIFWIIVAAIMFGVIYYSNEGEIRGFIFLGTALGVILYALLLSKIVVNASLIILRMTARVLMTVWTIISYPFRILIRIILIPFNLLFRVTGKTVRTIRRKGRNTLAKAEIWRRVFKNARKKI